MDEAIRIACRRHDWTEQLFRNQDVQTGMIFAEQDNPPLKSLLDVPPCDPVEVGVDLREWLIKGKIDALVHPDIVPSKLLARSTAKRLFDAAIAEEKGYFRATRIVPVMNVIAFREEELRLRPATVEGVFAAFCRAKEQGLDAMLDNRHSGLLWYWETLEEQIGLVGDDPVPYSVERMRTTLDAFLTHVAEQGLTLTKLPLSEIFARGLSLYLSELPTLLELIGSIARQTHSRVANVSG